MAPAKTGSLLGATLVALGCGGSANVDTSSTGAVQACQVGTGLDGVVYDVAKSRFAFGSPPVRDDQPGFVRWVGAHGVLGIEASGRVTGSMNGGAFESTLPDWSDDPDALSAHVLAYFVSLGVQPCQVPGTFISAGTDGRMVQLERGIDAIAVIESLAIAQVRNNDETTWEAFYWPALSAEVVAAARAFRDRLADAAGLAAYKAKLPADADGDGRLVVHHSSGLSTNAFEAEALYDVLPPIGSGRRSTRSFDADGNEVKRTW